jgi:hypothetical protein
MAKTDSWLDRTPGPRGSGAILLSIGLSFFYLGILSPVLSHRAPAYWPHLPLAVASLPPLVFGLLLVILGQGAENAIGDARKPSEWTRWLTIPLPLLALAIFFWLRHLYAA